MTSIFNMCNYGRGFWSTCNGPSPPPSTLCRPTKSKSIPICQLSRILSHFSRSKLRRYDNYTGRSSERVIIIITQSPPPPQHCHDPSRSREKSRFSQYVTHGNKFEKFDWWGKLATSHPDHTHKKINRNDENSWLPHDTTERLIWGNSSWNFQFWHYATFRCE
jgi:hypothetical protein